ncbi:MAG TPA: hypothetical protein VGN47_12405 [Blastococcus sp.]|jgi:hypothetical protein|nr:hypothetical protein [Blastococcus sp.]
MQAGAPRRAWAAAILGASLLALGACADGSRAGQAHGGNAASCALEITVAGTNYIGGRGKGTRPAPPSETVLHGTTFHCADGDVPSRPVIAHTIPGVRQTDAVVGPGGYVMLAERLWQQPWSALPPDLRPYIRQ